MNIIRHIVIISSLLTFASCATLEARRALGVRLSQFGHRNWIVVADSAYPLHAAAGIETIYVGGDLPDVLDTALCAIGRAGHVRPIIYIDAELDAVSEDDAPGITNYRAELARAVAGRNVTKEAHESLIRRLDADSKLFQTLVIKTACRLPYSSVFLQLDCGYWSEEAKRRLRRASGGGAK